MALTRDDLFARLDELGIRTETVTHPPLHTVEESRKLRGPLPGGHIKNLFLKDKKGRIFLIVAREDAPLDLKRVHEAIGGSGRVSFGSAEQLGDVLGVLPGSVTPLAVVNDVSERVTLVFERALLDHDVLNVHPLENTATTTIGRDDLLRFVRSTGHDPLVIVLPLRD